MGGFGTQELLVVLAILILLFGAKKIPDLSRSMGQSIRSFKRGMNEDADEKAGATLTAEEATKAADEAKRTADEAAKAADDAKRAAEDAARVAEAGKTS